MNTRAPMLPSPERFAASPIGVCKAKARKARSIDMVCISDGFVLTMVPHQPLSLESNHLEPWECPQTPLALQVINLNLNLTFPYPTPTSDTLPTLAAHSAASSISHKELHTTYWNSSLIRSARRALGCIMVDEQQLPGERLGY